MNTSRLLISYDKSQQDIPVLIVARECMTIFGSNPDVSIKKVITGKDASYVWDLLNNKDGDVT